MPCWVFECFKIAHLPASHISSQVQGRVDAFLRRPLWEAATASLLYAHILSEVTLIS